jgi:hypothetical protein
MISSRLAANSRASPKRSQGAAQGNQTPAVGDLILNNRLYPH